MGGRLRPVDLLRNHVSHTAALVGIGAVVLRAAAALAGWNGAGRFR
jgi:hypothetical protein